MNRKKRMKAIHILDLQHEYFYYLQGPANGLERLNVAEYEDGIER